MSDRSDALQRALKKIAADLAARGPVPYEASTAKVSGVCTRNFRA
jgi:hypothetical protein